MIPFDEGGFATLVSALRAQGYEFVLPGEVVSRPVLLRHDVDLSLRAAARLAEVEADLGVRSTYFLMCRSAFYALTTPEAASLIGTIAQAGHGMGLHWDAAPYARGGEAPVEAARREIDMLEWLSGRPCIAVSHHQPSLHGLADLAIDGVVNMYAPAVQQAYSYLSDSCMAWRQDPLEVIGTGLPLQLLLHPEYWAPGGADLAAVTDQLVAEEWTAVAERLRDECALMMETVRQRASFDGRLREQMLADPGR